MAVHISCTKRKRLAAASAPCFCPKGSADNETARSDELNGDRHIEMSYGKRSQIATAC